MKLNVLHLVLSFRPGGRRNAIADLVRHTACSVNGHLCCLEELGCDIDELDGQFRSISTLDRTQVGLVQVCRRLETICHERKIDLIHAHDAASQYLGTLIRFARPQIKLIMTFHRSLGFESARRQDKLRNAICGLFTHATVTASIERKRHYLSENHVAARNVVVIPFGVDLNRFRPDPQARAALRSRLGIGERTVVIGTVGHFAHVKGIDQAINAFNECSRTDPAKDVVLLVLGDGTCEQRERITRLADQSPSGRVILAGFQTDQQRWLSAFDVLLHTPRMEAFGLAVIEAMACRLPVVATRVGSMPELVRDGETGLLVKPDSIDSIVIGLNRVVEDRGFRDALGTRAYDLARQEYSATTCAGRYAQLYKVILAGGRIDGRRVSPCGRSVDPEVNNHPSDAMRSECISPNEGCPA